MCSMPNEWRARGIIRLTICRLKRRHHNDVINFISSFPSSFVLLLSPLDHCSSMLYRWWKRQNNGLCPHPNLSDIFRIFLVCPMKSIQTLTCQGENQGWLCWTRLSPSILEWKQLQKISLPRDQHCSIPPFLGHKTTAPATSTASTADKCVPVQRPPPPTAHTQVSVRRLKFIRSCGWTPLRLSTSGMLIWIVVLVAGGPPTTMIGQRKRAQGVCVGLVV